LLFDIKGFEGKAYSASMGLDNQAVVVLGEGLPLVGEQLPEAGDWMAHDASEHIVKVLPRIDVAGLARLDQAEEQGCGSGTPVTGGK
jgi:hypothetical protein